MNAEPVRHDEADRDELYRELVHFGLPSDEAIAALDLSPEEVDELKKKAAAVKETSRQFNRLCKPSEKCRGCR